MYEPRHFDLVAVGGGFAGICAAVRAAELGLRTAVLEAGANEGYLCSSRWAGGIFHVSYHDVKLPGRPPCRNQPPDRRGGGSGIGGDEAFREIKRPVLVLAGTKDQSDAGDRSRTLLPDRHFMFVYDAGRAIGAKRPEALTYIVLEFFERRDLFLASRESGMAFP
jgi:choline dehydrogenase-like flavoprotein